MMIPVLMLSPEAVAEDGMFRHPYLVPWNATLLAADEPLPLPQFAICHTDLPAAFCTCGRYVLVAEEEDSEALW